MITIKEKILENLLLENNGVLRTSDALAAGISKAEFYQLVQKVGLEKVAYGIYTTVDTLIDEMYLLQAQFPKVIFSHETALYLHELAECEPVPLTVTVSANYNSAGVLKKGAKVYYVKKNWYELGMTQMLSYGGNPLKVYDLERTICDIVRRSSSMDIAVLTYAIKEYVKRKDKNYARLSHYAVIFNIERKLREKMGVLL